MDIVGVNAGVNWIGTSFAINLPYPVLVWGTNAMAGVLLTESVLVSKFDNHTEEGCMGLSLQMRWACIAVLWLCMVKTAGCKAIPKSHAVLAHGASPISSC